MSPPLILQITDTVAGRSAALRLDDPADREAPLGRLLERCLRDGPDDDRLLRAGAVTADGLLALRSLRDLVCRCDDAGRLTGIFAGVRFLQQGGAGAAGLAGEGQFRSGDGRRCSAGADLCGGGPH